MCYVYFVMSENDVPVMLLEVVAFYLAKTKCDLKCYDYGVTMALDAWLGETIELIQSKGVI